MVDWWWNMVSNWWRLVLLWLVIVDGLYISWWVRSLLADDWWLTMVIDWWLRNTARWWIMVNNGWLWLVRVINHSHKLFHVCFNAIVCDWVFLWGKFVVQHTNHGWSWTLGTQLWTCFCSYQYFISVLVVGSFIAPIARISLKDRLCRDVYMLNPHGVQLFHAESCY